MKTQLKKNLSKKIALLVFSVLSILSGVVCFVVGEIALPLPIACLAALFLFDDTKERIASIISSAVFISVNAVCLYLGLTFSTFGFSAVVVAFVLYLMYKSKQTKSDTAFLLTILTAGFTLASCFLLAMMVKGSNTVDAVWDFYSTIASGLRTEFVALLTEAYNAAGVTVATEELVMIFDSQLFMIISYLMIFAFFIVGISLKLFGFIVGKCAEDDTEISSWKFITSKPYAYLYVILSFATLFISSFDSSFSVAILNLYNIFLFVYAYVGFNVALALLSRRLRPFGSLVLLVVIFLISSSLCVQILAVIGAIFTIRKNNEAKNVAS